RFGVTVTTKVSERITINGKVGVPTGGINESAIVGDVEVQYRVNEDGTLNLRVFNRENDINYIGEGIGYTQGVGISYEVDFDTFKEFANRVFKNLKIDQLPSTKVVEEIPDSEELPPGTTFADDKEKKEPEKIEQNKEAIPQED
ncbi:MAG TPA: translocation/assembly module TamB domain-containing protein, partial [Flavobacterium sp.]